MKFLEKFKKKPEKVVFHPRVKIPIKYAFECEGKHFYQAVNDYEVPKRRFAFAKKFYDEMQNKVTSETLTQFCEKGKELCSGKDGKVDLGQVWKLWDELHYRSQWLFEPESLLRFASVVYFTLDENLNDYDFEYNKIKIASFEKKKLTTTFLKMLSTGQKILSDLSPDALQAYLYELTCQVERQKKMLNTSEK